MAFHDFIPNRSLRITAAGRSFTIRPVTVLGMLDAQAIIAASANPDITIEGLKAAVAGGDASACRLALAEFYLSILDGIGADRLARLFALVTEPPDADMIEHALRTDPAAIMAFLGAIGQLHDFPRILARFARAKEPQILPAHVAETEGIGLETAILDVATFLPQYTIEDILNWPYERLISVQEQKAIMLAIRDGRAAKREDDVPSLQKDEAKLRAMGMRVQRKPKKSEVN